MNERVLIYPGLVASALGILSAFLLNAYVPLVAAAFAFIIQLLILVAIRRRSLVVVIPPEFQAKLASLEFQNQRQVIQLDEQMKQIEEQRRTGESLSAEISALKQEKTAYASSFAQLQNTLEAAQGSDEQAIIQFVRNLQSRGRLLDFLMADIHKLADSQVGAAARIVHQGLRDLMNDYFSIIPIATADEGSLVTIPEGQLGKSYRVLQSRGDELPERGRLVHKGWQASSVNLPQRQIKESSEARPVLAAAEIDTETGEQH